MENKPCKMVYRGGVGEIKEKKSRFIGTVNVAETEEEALAQIAETKKQHREAAHNCFAFTLGNNHEIKRCSDDGEPNGTAGRPMLDLLLKEDIHNVVVIVTRYFGGTLLGTGGLVRAYQKAVQEGLSKSVLIVKNRGIMMAVSADYSGMGKILYILEQYRIEVLDTVYTDMVTIKILVPAERQEEVEAAVADGTNGKASFEIEGTAEFASVEGKIEILKKS